MAGWRPFYANLVQVLGAVEDPRTLAKLTARVDSRAFGSATDGAHDYRYGHLGRGVKTRLGNIQQ